MKLFKKVESVLDRFKYQRYYLSNLLTLIRMMEASLLHRVDMLSHKAVGDLEQLYKILCDNQAKFTAKGKTYQDISSELALASSTTESLINELLKKKVIDKMEPLIGYYMAMSDHTSGIYRDIDKVIEKVGLEKVQQTRITNEIASMFWLTDLKGKYIIHVGDVWDKLIKFFRKYGLYLPILSEFNEKTICESLDPNRQYFIAANDISQLFGDLTYPANIQRLYEETTITKTIQSVKQALRINRNLRLRFKNKMDIKSTLHNNDLIEINADRLILADGTSVKNSYPNITRFGADPHNEVLLKHEYISRAQFIVITDATEDGFFIVCTSPSNSTRVLYQAPTILKQQMLIKLGKDQLFNIQKLKHYEQQTIEELQPSGDKTLTHIPTRSKIKVSEIHVQLLTGKYKNKVVILRYLSNSDRNVFNFGGKAEDDVYCDVSGQITFCDGLFKISNNAQILLKTTSEHNGLRPSRKIRLKQGDRVFSQEFQFEVDA